jgi:hypothetical protein
MRFLMTAMAAVSAAGFAALGGCGGGDSGTGGSTTSGSGAGGSTSASASSGTGGTHVTTADKVDLVLAIDNSRSMADKQKILAAALPDLVGALVNPKCIDQTTFQPSAMQPAGPMDPCPDAASKREQTPVLDIHIGVITSSLGGHGADACPNSETTSCPGGVPNTSNNDLGHLVSRQDPCTVFTVPTYVNKGFLAWDPSGKLNPKGESSVGSLDVDPGTGNVTNGTPGLLTSLKDMVLGVGQIGCGYESQLESVYRFLIDPNPYQSIVVNAQGSASPQGTDAVLLQQRKDFLRPSSVLAIVVLSDENDCSIKEFGQFYFAAQLRDPGNPGQNFHLPRPRSECATNPNDTCCRSCGQDQTGCPADPTCTAGTGKLDDQTDNVNLRCWDQKRRFGIDFLYPTDRYVTGLSSLTVPDRTGNLVPNPIFSDLDPSDGDSAVRDPSLVVFAGIVGVPWQDLALDPFDLKKGLKTSTQLAATNAVGHTTWEYIIGDPDKFVLPLDPHMIESNAPRAGTDPITGVALAPPTAPAGTDKINGHEYTPGTQGAGQGAPNDLEYACIFDLPQPRDCSNQSLVSCDCQDPQNDNPLCEPDPAQGGNRTLQVRAKAYPGIRELSLIKKLGPQGIAASICPAQLSDATAADYAYRPAVDAISGVILAHFPKP